MAIKAIINNTEKEIEQIKNSNEQDIDYVYSRIGDTEVEGEPPISIKSVGGNLADYRIYGNTVDGESVGDRTGNLFDKSGSQYGNNLHWVPTGSLVYSDTYYGSPIMDVTGLNTITRSYTGTSANYFLTSDLSQFVNVSNIGTVDAGVTVNVPDGYTKYVFNIPNTIRPDSIMVNSGSTALPYEPYGYKVPMTVEGKNLFDNSKTANILKCYLSISTLVSSVSTRTIFIECKPSTTYTVSKIRGERFAVGWSDKLPAPGVELQEKVTNYTASSITITTGLTAKYLVAYIYNAEQDAPITADEMIASVQIEKGSTATPYEPYHAPVTTPIYLPEQLRMVGDEAEYIDYAEQKQHRVRKNLAKNNYDNSSTLFTVEVVNNFIHVSGTNNSGSIKAYKISKENVFPAGSYDIVNNSDTTIGYDYRDNNDALVYGTVNANSIKTFNFPATFTRYLNIYKSVPNGESIDNYFQIMVVRHGTDTSTYEPYIENTDLDVTLPALSTIKGTNTFSVNTSIQPSNIYIKDNFDYKKVFTATRTIEGESPLNYRSIEDSDSTLNNYRIYGQTVNGESVGDRTANLIQGSIKNANIGNNGKINTLNEFFLVYAPVVTGESYTISNNNGTNVYAFYNAVPSTETATSYDSNRQIFSTSTITFVSPITGYIAVRLANTAQDIMINPGSTAVPYEPVGYRVPVTVEGKNLLPNTATSKTINGVTFTVNNDGSITCNGTATQTAVYTLNDTFSLEPGTYNLTGCPAGGWYTDKYKLDIVAPPITYGTDIGNGSSFTSSSTFTNAQYRIIIYNNQTCDNLTFYPMIRKADIEDDTYEPYHAPVTTPIYLPEPIKMVGDEAEYIDYAEQKMHRVRKNLLQNTATGLTTYGVTITVNDDGSVTCNGTATSTIVFLLFEKELGQNTYILSGCPENGAHNERYKIQINPGDGWYADIGNGLEFEIQNTSTIKVRTVIYPSYTCNNLTFYPMIRKADIEDDTYEPYIENTDLDVTLPALPTIKGTNTMSVGTEVQPSGVEIKGHIK